MKKYLLPEGGSFYKANLHCHTTVSDGAKTPEEIKKIYKNMGYSIVAYTDHNVLVPHPELNDDSFLALNGFEGDVTSSDNSIGYYKTCHICYIAIDPDNTTMPFLYHSKFFEKYSDVVKYNCGDYKRVYSTECINDMIKKGREAGYFVTYNHPTWSLEEYSDYLNYDGMNAVEMFNGGCICAGYDDWNPRVYEDLLRNGKKIYCIGSDDNHNRAEVGSPDCDSGWAFTVIKADSLAYSDVTKALVDGSFYASEAPEIYELYVEDGEVHIKCSPAARITITYDVRLAFALNAPEGETVTEATFKTHYDYGWFRLTVIDREGKRACTNAYYFDDFNN